MFLTASEDGNEDLKINMRKKIILKQKMTDISHNL
jgi:hypothetical protein